jgi:DNA-binding IclR family transcriptional regulator
MEIYTVCCVPSAQRLQVIVEVGGRRPLHATAAGKLFLAYGPEELFDALSPNGKFPKITARTIESRIAMRREIAVIKKYGIAHNREESYAGASAVAAPIYSDDSVIIASLTTIFPVALVTPSDMLQIETEVRETARRITEGLSKHTKQHHPKPLRRISS